VGELAGNRLIDLHPINCEDLITRAFNFMFIF
jgi:hypothetical protein